MRSAPDFERVESALEDALAAMPLSITEGVSAEVRQEYIALTLFILQTKERLALLAGSWAAKGYPMAQEKTTLIVDPLLRRPSDSA